MRLVRRKQRRKRPKHSWISSVPGFLLIDSSFAPLACNQEGAAILSYPHKPNLERIEKLPIPREILDGIREHKWTKASSLVIPFQAGRRTYLCYAFPLHSGRLSLAPPGFALLLQRSSSADETVSRMAAQFHLTGREREILQGTAAGLNSRQLATRMRISPNTVKVYLHLVMVKLGVTSRAGMVAKILEQSTGVGRQLRAADAARKLAESSD